jgi:hypothetical protein
MATVECGLNAKDREDFAPYIEIGWKLLNP